MGSQQVLDILYLILLAVLIRHMVTVYKTRKLVGKENLLYFTPRNRILSLVAASVIIVLGIANMIANPSFMSSLYIVIGVVFVVINLDRIQISNQGIYSNGRMDYWHEIKRWQFSDNAKVLYLETTKPGAKSTRAIQIKLSDKDEINTIIREYKSKKKNKVNK